MNCVMLGKYLSFLYLFSAKMKNELCHVREISRFLYRFLAKMKMKNELCHVREIHIVVFTNKRSQAKVYIVYFGISSV